MTSSKLPRSKKELLGNALAPRVIEGDPEVYTREEQKVLIEYGLRYARGLVRGRLTTNNKEQAEAFRRRFEIITIFRRLPERLRKRPTGEATKVAVLERLEKIGFTIDGRTLMRDYKALGGAEFLRGAKPFEPEEDMSSPFANGSTVEA